MKKDPATFTRALLEWYSTQGRDLPWRHTRDPYKVWISEIMLQQTQVSRVEKTFYPRFLEKFPTVQDLAQSSWDEVYPVWKGLGYYIRGKNLLQASQKVVHKWDGVFPHDLQKLKSLPGVGEYTARAILSFTWDKKIPAIDTNIQKIIRTLWPQEKVDHMAKELLGYADSGRDWNGAMMDLATALRSGEKIEGSIRAFFPEDICQEFLPQRKKTNQKNKRKWQIEVGIACIHQDGKYLIQTRPEGKSFVGYWEFPGGKREKGEDFRTCVKREVQEELGIEVSVRPHFYEEICSFNRVNLRLRFHRCQIQKGIPAPQEGQKLDWVAPEKFQTIKFLETNAQALKKLQKIRV
ncbi:NUDIX domain-containing protein [Candidatus Gracilibacteria bacterium]|nr:NUDIX domain-containing protein [Candidatus Gracilibacteria bacterium]MCF7819399.1 NUDIX domain-containing protein [Candidatus Gracilibacteria bacterium]